VTLKNKKILVIGGAGFVGSNLCRALCRHNEVVSLDNYLTGSLDNHVSGVLYLEGDAREVGSIVKDRDFDFLFHLGEYSRVEQSVHEPDFVLENNISSIFPILNFAKNCGGCKFIYSGSSTKFGDGGKSIHESPYAFAKNMNSSLVSYYCDEVGLDWAICYFYNVYGKNEIGLGKYATVVAKFKQSYLSGEPLTVVGDGNQRRNFTHIDDIVSGIIMVADRGQGDGYGIGCQQSISVLELAHMFDCEIQHLPDRKGNRSNSDLVVDKTKELGWVPLNNIYSHIQDFLEGH